MGGECSGVVGLKLGVGVSNREGGCLNDPWGVCRWCVVCWLLVCAGGVGLKLGVEVLERFAGLDRSELGDGFRSLLSCERVCGSLGCRDVGVANAWFVRVFCSVFAAIISATSIMILVLTMSMIVFGLFWMNDVIVSVLFMSSCICLISRECVWMLLQLWRFVLDMRSHSDSNTEWG